MHVQRSIQDEIKQKPQVTPVVKVCPAFARVTWRESCTLSRFAGALFWAPEGQVMACNCREAEQVTRICVLPFKKPATPKASVRVTGG